MKVFAILANLVSICTFAAAVGTTYDQTYDNASRSLNAVACSNGPNGLITRGFTTFGSFPTFPHIGGAPAVAGWNSPNCGSCWNLTYTNPQGISKSISILAIDYSSPDFNIALTAMNDLTGTQGVQSGRVPVAAAQIAASNCGL